MWVIGRAADSDRVTEPLIGASKVSTSAIRAIQTAHDDPAEKPKLFFPVNQDGALHNERAASNSPYGHALTVINAPHRARAASAPLILQPQSAYLQPPTKMRISTNFVTLAELYTPGTQTIRQVPVSEYRYCPKHEIGHSNARIGTDQALQPQAKDCAAAERNHTCVVPAVMTICAFQRVGRKRALPRL